MVSYTKRHNRAWERKPKTFANEKSAKELERTWIVRLHFSRHLFHVWAVKQYFLHRSSLGLARHSFELLRSFLHRFRFQNVSFFHVFSLSLSLRHFHQEPTHDSRDSRRGTLFSRLFRSLALLSRALVSSVVVVVNIFLVKFKGNSSLSWEGLGFYIKSNSNDV